MITKTTISQNGIMQASLPAEIALRCSKLEISRNEPNPRKILIKSVQIEKYDRKQSWVSEKPSEVPQKHRK